MKGWLSQLDARSRRALLAGGGVAALLLGYALVWLPLERRVTHLEERVPEQRALLAWMETAAARIEAAREGAGAAGGPGGPLLSTISGAAREHGLEGHLRQIQPEGEHRVRVWLEAAAFEDVVAWLDELAAAHGVRVLAFSAGRASAPGRSDARITLGVGSE